MAFIQHSIQKLKGMNMNKKLILVFTLILTAFLMIGAVSAGGWFDFLGGAGSNSNDNQTLVVGVGPDLPPFNYKDGNGQYIGFDNELAKEVAKRNNWTLKIQPLIDWNSKDNEVNSNEIDCIWSDLTIEGRENNFLWSNPYFNNTQVFVLRTDNQSATLDDLKGKTVEVLDSSSALESLNGQNKTLNDTFAKVTQVSDYNTAFLDLQSGVCDVVICDVGYANYQLNETYANEPFVIIDEPLQYEKYGIAFKKGNDDLRNQVQKTLDEMFKDGTVDKIAQNYSNYQIPQRLIAPTH